MSLGLPAPIWLESSSESRNYNWELHNIFRINSARLQGPTICQAMWARAWTLFSITDWSTGQPHRQSVKWQRLNLNTDLLENWVHLGMPPLSLVILSTWRASNIPVTLMLCDCLCLRVTNNLLWHNWHDNVKGRYWVIHSLLPTFCRWENWSPKRFSNSPKIIRWLWMETGLLLSGLGPFLTPPTDTHTVTKIV